MEKRIKKTTKLILYPSDLPRHFAATVKRHWLIKRSGVGVSGERLYTIEHWGKGGSLEYSIHFSAKWFLDFLAKFEEVYGRPVQLWREYGGVLYRVCKENGIAANDTRTYDELEVAA